MTHVTCRLIAKNCDQLRNPTLGNRVWATFFIIEIYAGADTVDSLWRCHRKYILKKVKGILET